MENPYPVGPRRKKGGFVKVLLIILAVLVGIFLILLLIGILADDGAADSAKPASAASAENIAQLGNSDADWTLLLYLCGTDLESKYGSCTDNLLECASVALPDTVNLLLCTGGTEDWSLDFVDPNAIQYHRLYGEGDYETLETLPLSSMGDPGTLSNFLSYGVKAFPAKKYGVILWNHGGGMSGVAFDELYEGDALSLTDLNEGFSQANANLEFIGFDACLMATLEAALELSPYAGYMIASEEVEPGSGWDYAAMLNSIVAEPSQSGAELGKVICDTYMEKCGEYADSCTLSVTDLTKVEPLARAFDDMADEMTLSAEDVDTFRTLKQGIAKAESYGGNTDEEGYFNLVDIGDMVLNSQSVLPKTGDSVLNALFEAVVYNVNGSARANANGLAAFYPIKAGNDELDAYARSAAFSHAYLDFIAASRRGWKVPADFVGADFSSPAPEPAQTVADTDYTLDAETYLADDGSYVLEIISDPSYVAGVYFTLYQMDYEYNEYMYFGRDDDLNVTDDLTTYSDNFRGVWPALNGVFVNLTLLESTDEYNLYSIPILLNGEEMNLRARYDWASEKYEVMEAVGGAGENSFSSRKQQSLQDGDEVEVLMTGVNWESGEETLYSVGSFTVKGGVTLEELALPDGDYLYQYELEDVLSETYTSEEVIMECKDGEITVYETE